MNVIIGFWLISLALILFINGFFSDETIIDKIKNISMFMGVITLILVGVCFIISGHLIN